MEGTTNPMFTSIDLEPQSRQYSVRWRKCPAHCPFARRALFPYLPNHIHICGCNDVVTECLNRQTGESRGLFELLRAYVPTITETSAEPDRVQRIPHDPLDPFTTLGRQ